ncbi:helix-turn-helix transcriptional regulator [bacterium]|nr:helix-turn-helix transcriptional regulator [bacterium]
MQTLLTRLEEMYLLVIWELKDNAYGVSIRKQLYTRTGRQVSYGGLYFTLDQLVKKGLAEKTESKPTGGRGGRRRFYYLLTPAGNKALREVYAHQNRLWNGIDDMAIN